jgi:hypothetical protein
MRRNEGKRRTVVVCGIAEGGREDKEVRTLLKGCGLGS